MATGQQQQQLANVLEALAQGQEQMKQVISAQQDQQQRTDQNLQTALNQLNEARSVILSQSDELIKLQQATAAVVFLLQEHFQEVERRGMPTQNAACKLCDVDQVDRCVSRNPEAGCPCHASPESNRRFGQMYVTYNPPHVHPLHFYVVSLAR